MADLFLKQSKQYVVGRPGYPEKLFQFIASKAAAHDLAWDVGTGSGQAARSELKIEPIKKGADIHSQNPPLPLPRICRTILASRPVTSRHRQHTHQLNQARTKPPIGKLRTNLYTIVVKSGWSRQSTISTTRRRRRCRGRRTSFLLENQMV